MASMAIQTRAGEFRQALDSRVLVADGAMGTALYSKGILFNRCYDELNLSLPALVRDVHQEHIGAGAEILQTNTFGANRKRLAAFGFADKVRPINRAGVRIAREAARGLAFVAGTIGPLGIRLEPLGPTSLSEARAIFREQAEALAEAGVDLLILETFRDANEIREAIFAVRDAVGDEIAVIAQVSVEEDGHLGDGASSEAFTRHLNEWPADVIGLNCCSGPKVVLETIERMAQYTTKPLSAMPNAGLPTVVEGGNLYPCSPEYMARYARRFLDAGVKIVGGCCGTTASHVAHIRNEIRNPAHAQPARSVAVVESATAGCHELDQTAMADKSLLGAKLAAGKFVTMVEILPPRGTDASKEIEGAKLCRAAAIDCVNVPDGPRASARMSAQVACQILQREAGIEAVLHFCCRDRNILSIQSDLLGAHAAGIRNLICITGDPPRVGIYPDATGVFDVDAIGLVKIAKNLNRGLDLGGHPIGSQTALLIGVAANPGAWNMDEELRRFERKVETGAEYAVTQPVFDIDRLEAFVKRTERYNIPFIASIWPLTSHQNAEFLVNELRVPVPEVYLDRIRQAESAEAAGAEGIAIARELVERIKPMVAGVQLSAPFGRYRTAIEVAEAIGAHGSN